MKKPATKMKKAAMKIKKKPNKKIIDPGKSPEERRKMTPGLKAKLSKIAKGGKAKAAVTKITKKQATKLPVNLVKAIKAKEASGMKMKKAAMKLKKESGMMLKKSMMEMKKAAAMKMKMKKK